MLKNINRRIKHLIGVIRFYKNWSMRILDFAGLYPSKKVKYRLRNGLVFNARRNKVDHFVIREVMETHTYDKYKKIGKEDIIIDIGANIGAFSVYAGKIAESGIVYAFEPVKENFALLQENITANNLKNVKALNLGVAGKSKKAKILLLECDSKHSIYLAEEPIGSQEAEFISMKKIFGENKIDHCDFLKIDCEGSEYEILFNTPKEIFKKINYIAIEFHEYDKTYNPKRLNNFIKENGFETEFSKEKESDKWGMIYASNTGKP